MLEQVNTTTSVEYTATIISTNSTVQNSNNLRFLL